MKTDMVGGRLLLLSAAVVVVATFALFVNPRGSEQGAQVASDAPRPQETRAWDATTPSARLEPAHTRSGKAHGPSEVGEDHVSIGWDDAAPDARRQHLDESLDDAFARLREDASDVKARADAEEALSALRTEMYGTPTGQQRHRELEETFDGLVAINSLAAGMPSTQ